MLPRGSFSSFGWKVEINYCGGYYYNKLILTYLIMDFFRKWIHISPFEFLLYGK